MKEALDFTALMIGYIFYFIGGLALLILLFIALIDWIINRVLSSFKLVYNVWFAIKYKEELKQFLDEYEPTAVEKLNTKPKK